MLLDKYLNNDVITMHQRKKNYLHIKIKKNV